MKDGKRRRDVLGAGRLSDLTDGILHHILSFLDTEYVVRSSILSRMWRWVWKDIPVLTFHGRSCRAKL
ncbi:unnamed protein product [Linum trigynum]|uniref:F-box domain-containing protein n=1 Tax=Linum trigynum TaxID=586398 RepID=A0AAV2EC25_9ROSI